MNGSHWRDVYLFLIPPIAVRPEIAWWRDSLGPFARPIADERLHMTVGGFGQFAETPYALIGTIADRLFGLSLPSCRLCLDTLVRARDRTLLISSEPLSGFNTLQARVAKRLGIDGREWKRHCRPHMTLGHGSCPAPTLPIDPISWTADQLVLVESLRGLQKHVVHAIWALVAAGGLAA